MKWQRNNGNNAIGIHFSSIQNKLERTRKKFLIINYIVFLKITRIDLYIGKLQIVKKK